LSVGAGTDFNLYVVDMHKEAYSLTRRYAAILSSRRAVIFRAAEHNSAFWPVPNYTALWHEVHICEQLAQSPYVKVERPEPEVEPEIASPTP